MNRNLKPCPACGKEVAKSAKVCPHCGKQLKMGWFLKLGLIIIALIAIGYFFSPKERDPKPTYDKMVQEIINAEVSALKTDGMVAKLIEQHNNTPESQRDSIDEARYKLEKMIKDVIVVWELPIVYVSKKENNVYIVATEQQPRSPSGKPLVATTVAIYARNDEEIKRLESLAKGDTIKFKGRVRAIDHNYRINIGLAILWDK